MRFNDFKLNLVEAILDEVEMSPRALKDFLASKESAGMKMGFELEMCVPGARSSEDSDYSEKDYGYDERSDNIENITNALDKVDALVGFTYNWNDLAASMGYNTNERLVGVSAQDVQKVLPEAVKPAPVNKEYLTVQYEKIVPLLIEAIKELRLAVDNLSKK